MWRERERFVDAKPACGLVWSWGWVTEWVSSGQQGHQAYGLFLSVCVCTNLRVLILLFRQMYSARCITTLEAMIFYDSLPVSVFYIKLYVSPGPSYCWAIRPPLSSRFFLCPFPLHPPFSAPTLVLSLFLPYLSLLLSPSWLSLSNVVSPCSSLRLSLLFLYFLPSRSLWRYSLLMAQELFSLRVCWSQFPSQAGHTLLALVADCPQAPRNKHAKWFPARGFCVRWEWRERGKNRGFM